MIHFDCSNCSKKVSVADEHAGKQGKCPNCKQVVTIPSEAEEPNPLLDALADMDRPSNEPLRTYEVPEEKKKCPYCAEAILDTAMKCKHCGEWLGRERLVQEPLSQRARGKNTSGILIKSVIAGVLFMFCCLLLIGGIWMWKGGLEGLEFDFSTRKNPETTTQEPVAEEEELPDPTAVAFVDQTQPLIQAARRFQSLREVGGNYMQYRDAIVELKAAQLGAPEYFDHDSRFFLQDIEKAMESYSAGLQAWSFLIKSEIIIGNPKQTRDRKFEEGDKYLAQALQRYEYTTVPTLVE